MFHFNVTTLRHWGFPEDILDTILRARYEDAERMINIIILHIKHKLSQRGSGRRYYRRSRTKLRQYTRKSGTKVRYQVKNKYGGRRFYHTASAPGEPPAPWTGRYRESWEMTSSPILTGSGWVGVWSDLWDEFGARLEYGGAGTDGQGRTVMIAPRPHLRPALLEAEKFFRSL